MSPQTLREQVFRYEKDVLEVTDATLGKPLS